MEMEDFPSRAALLRFSFDSEHGLPEIVQIKYLKLICSVYNTQTQGIEGLC